MILKVPYYSQIKDTKNPQWKKNSCGIAALKMVLDFYEQSSRASRTKPTNLTIDELYQRGLDINGFLIQVGWYHHSLAQLAKQFGFHAITRSWNITTDALEKLHQRGFENTDIEIIEDQQLEEGLSTLKSEIELKHPVILSVTKDFIEGGSGHLVTLIGFDDTGFIINDPFGGEKIKIDFDQFKKIWSKRAIIIRKN